MGPSIGPACGTESAPDHTIITRKHRRFHAACPAAVRNRKIIARAPLRLAAPNATTLGTVDEGLPGAEANVILRESRRTDRGISRKPALRACPAFQLCL